MGFFSELLKYTAAAGIILTWKEKYKEYDDESLFNEYVDLYRECKSGYSDEETETKLSIVKSIMQERDLF